MSEYIKIVRTKKQKEQLNESLFANFEPREWQQELLDILSQDPDPRHVHWIWDAVGNQGKSYMAKYLSVTQGATILKCAGTKTDLAYICSEQLSRTYIFDLSRTLEKRDGGSTTSYDPMDKVYEIMEELKAGALQSTKYHSHSGPIQVPVPHVVAFAKTQSASSLRQRKDAIWTPFLTRKRPVTRGNTKPFRSIGWVTAPAPFPTSERGRDSQRDH